MIYLPHRRKAFQAGGLGFDKTGLVGWWSMEDESGGFVDAHTTSNNFTENGTPLYEQSGKTSNAVEFDGSTDYGDISSAIMGAQPTDYSLVCWIKGPASGQSYILGQCASSTTPLLYLGTDSSNKARIVLRFDSGTLDVDVSSSTTVLDDTNWYHIAYTHGVASDEHRLYVNGSEDATPSTRNVVWATSCTLTGLGALARPSASNHFDGLIDEASIWTRELTASEIGELYNSGTGIGYGGL